MYTYKSTIESYFVFRNQNIHKTIFNIKQLRFYKLLEFTSRSETKLLNYCSSVERAWKTLTRPQQTVHFIKLLT